MEYTIRLTEQDLPILSAALVELPFKIVAPLIDKINRQLAEQTQTGDDVVEAKPNETK